MKHLELHNILTDSQHGIRAKRSTETQLIQTIRDISKSLEKKETVDWQGSQKLYNSSLKLWKKWSLLLPAVRTKFV